MRRTGKISDVGIEGKAAQVICQMQWYEVPENEYDARKARRKQEELTSGPLVAESGSLKDAQKQGKY